MKLRLKLQEWSKYDILGFLTVFPLILSTMVPSFTTFGNNAIVCLACEMLWLLVAWFQSPNTLKHIVFKMWYTIPYMVYVAVVPYLFGNSSIGNRYMNFFPMIIGVFIFAYYYELNNLKIIGSSIAVALPFFLLTLLITIVAGCQNSYLIRQIDYNDQWIMYMRLGIGGYHFIYPLAIIAIEFFAIGLEIKGKKKYVFIGVSALFAFTVLVSNFFTAVVMIIAGVAVAILIKLTEKNKRNIIIAGIFIIVVYIIFEMGLKNIFVNIFQEDGRIYAVLSGEGTIIGLILKEFISDRGPTIMLSLDAYLDNSAFGLVITPILTDGVYDISYGQHSFVFDTFALYGTVIGIVASVIVFIPHMMKNFYKNYNGVNISVLIAVFIMTFFNNLTPSFFMVTSVLCPYFIHYFLEENEWEELLEKGTQIFLAKTKKLINDKLLKK